MWFECRDPAVVAIVVATEPYEMIVMRATEKVVTAGAKVRKGSVHVAEKRRLSSIRIEPNGKRPRSQYLGHGGRRCDSPERADTGLIPGSLELRIGNKNGADLGTG
ncbi:hypothetical protein FA13DRAFT_1745643, partial [Coprinellus micaceus]